MQRESKLKLNTQRNMYSRTNSMTVTVQQERFAFSGMATRSREPEVFTFEHVPAQVSAVRSYVPIRPKRRCTRVMYPSKVRMHLPPPEKSQAKRLLVILCLVVLWQIYTEEPCAETPLGSADSPVSDCHGLSFQSAEKQEQQQRADYSADTQVLSVSTDSSPSEQIVPSNNCAEPGQEQQGSGAGKGYMVALLVYHKLGSDN